MVRLSIRRWGVALPILIALSSACSFPSGDGIPRVGESVAVDQLPVATQRQVPVYPEAARRKGLDGTVLVRALVSREGVVLDAIIQKSIPELDDAALTAIRQWRFRPATRKKAPVAVWVSIPVKFTLR